jgi:hypothetical protein
MRYRYLVVSLVGLMVGCQYCPLRSHQPGTADINDPSARTQLGNGEIARPAPLPLEQPAPLTAMPVTP